MGKISNYTRALVAKLQDVFVIDQTDNNVTTTKSVTVEQIGDTIAGTQIHSDLKTDSQTIIGGINELAKDKNVADEYDDTHTYNIGDVTIYGNTLYICTANNTTGAWDATKWTATTIDNVIGSLSTLTTTDKSSIVGAVNEVNGYKPTKDIGGTAKGVNATYQIPAGVLAHSIITIALRRYAYAGEVTILTENITAGAYTNGLTVFGAHDKYAEFSISTTGLITITAISNWAEVYIDLIGIF